MPSFSDLLRQIIQAPEFEVSSKIPGDWEALEPGTYQSHSGRAWSHSVDEGFSDCILGVEIDDEHLMNIVVSLPKFEWQVHQLRVKRGREIQRVAVTPPVSDSTTLELHTAVVRGIAECKRSWKSCKHCGNRQPSAYMQERGVCMGCAPSVLGIIY